MLNPEQVELRLHENGARTEAYLREVFSELPESSREEISPLSDAMLYSLMAGGKRIRPSLVLEACRAAGGSPEAALPFAAAIEMIHTYSLIHDDLPCMDDDSMRRGKPSNHVVYGYANALLAGDALLTEAFGVLSRGLVTGVPAEQVVMATALLSRSAGMDGMVGGQVMDLKTDGAEIDFSTLLSIHSRKTCELILSSVELGLLAAGRKPEERIFSAFDEYAHQLGLVFQLVDDVLDATGDPETLGKTVGKDAKSDKKTYLSFMSIPEAMALAEGMTEKAVLAVANYDLDGFFTGLADYLLKRKK